MQWLAELCRDDFFDEDVVLVTVVRVEGSTPRDRGARMLVSRARLSGTIGGGHLEYCATRYARTMLGTDNWTDHSVPLVVGLEHFALGPTLGQCCGGTVQLAFEAIRPKRREQLSIMYTQWQLGLACLRLVPLDIEGHTSLYDRRGQCLHGSPQELMNGNEEIFTSDSPTVLEVAGRRWFVDPCLPYRSHLILFGAGHVGHAIVRVLGEMACRVTWVDERADQFTSVLPPNVKVEVCDAPEIFVDHAPPGTSFLVLTHSHPLDQKLAEKIILRDDVQWFGLIGSRTKRIRFERRLRARGIAEQRIARMVCPIGIDGINGKEPAVIAVAVVAQLLQVWQMEHSQTSDVSPQRINDRMIEP